MSCNVTANERLCKQPSEKRYYSMNFSNLLDSGETLQSIVSITEEKLDGSSSSDLTFSGQTLSSDLKSVEVWIEGGVDRKRYHVVFKVITSAGAELEGEGALIIKER